MNSRTYALRQTGCDGISNHMDLDKRDELLFQILTELHLIRLALTDEGNTQALYRCTECDTQIFGDELEHHAQRQHKWHSDLGEVRSMGLYERIH